MDATVERVILRCLENDAGQRPPSALAVAAALPGGDPLAAALAAGETPSPDMVANAGGEGTFRPGVAVVCLFVFLCMEAIHVGLTTLYPPVYNLYQYASLEKPPDVLVNDAQSILAQIGHDAEPVDVAYGFAENREYLNYIQENDNSPDRWERLRSGWPPALGFWYRQSPRLLEPERGLNWRVSASDPPLDVSGMATVGLDTTGLLRNLHVVPPQLSEGEAPAGEPNWSALFEAAGLDIAQFSTVEPIWVPDDFYDSRAAWEGVYPTDADMKIRVEAASFRGQPFWFEIIDSWARPERMDEPDSTRSQKFFEVFSAALLIAVVVGALLLARRNLRLGRGDRRGATRLALFMALLWLLNWALTASHVPRLWGELTLFINGLTESLLWAVVVWLVYIALEPFVRRRWPEALVSWNRLLAGRLRDPRIGRDILAAAAALAVIVLVNIGQALVKNWLGLESWSPTTGDSTDLLLGGRYVITYLGQQLMISTLIPVIALFVLLLFRIAFRKQWLAFAALVTISGLLEVPEFFVAGNFYLIGFLVHLVVWLVIWAMIIVLFTRFGLLSLCACFFLGSTGNATMPRIDLTAWHGTGMAFCMLVGLATVSWAFYISLGGRSLFRKSVVPEE
jgi:serine/threonine-protein kinase